MADLIQLPSKPDLVLRLGFVGTRKLPGNVFNLTDALQQVFSVIHEQMADIAKNKIAAETRTSYYSDSPPCIRLITGLAEGADTLAYEVLNATIPGKQPLAGTGSIKTELAAVLGCSIEEYRSKRDAAHLPTFDNMLRSCSYVLPLDGKMVDGPEGKIQRARLYRAQATTLIRQADILLAVPDPTSDATPKAGGTMETINQALHEGQLVVFINASTGKVNLIENIHDLPDITEDTSSPTNEWKKPLKDWVNSIAVGSNLNQSTTTDNKLLQEYFGAHKTPCRSGKGRKRGMRERCWRWYEGLFKGNKLPVASDPVLKPYDVYRKRATELNYHYAGRYRGAFLLNYVVAVIAVLMAVTCLSLLKFEASHLAEGTPGTAEESHITPFTSWLIVLGVLKLSCLIFIFFNSRMANKNKWNDKAVGYRYLAERLRNMYYLPKLGSFRPPAAAPPQKAGYTQMQQSQADWLFDAIVRSVSPQSLSKKANIILDNKEVEVNLLQLELPKDMVAMVKEKWIKNQVNYHIRNHTVMESMNKSMEHWGAALNWIVLGIVIFDILLLIGLITHTSLPFSDFLHHNAYILIMIAAIFPVMVACLNSIRFQSECERLAQRSSIVRSLLDGGPDIKGGREMKAENLHKKIIDAANDPDKDPGSWAADALLLGESVAGDLTREVAEWGMLYAKELAEP